MSRAHRALFASVRSEGGLLPSTLLERLSNGDRTLGGTDPVSYHLEPGERINEAASRAWTRLLPAWRGFREGCSKLPEKDAGTSLTRERWILPLFQELGYGRLQAVRGAIEIEGRSFPISHKWGGCPIHLVGFRTELDRRTAGVAGAARSSPHSLVQEYLNKVEDSLWGYVSNGLALRILRDNVRLTRQSFVEFDLEAMMEGEAYSDFVLLWMVAHQSRVEAEKPHDCWLEKWSREAAEQGTRALDRLRDGVEEAIRALGRGFLSHPANGALREKLRSGALTKEDYYRQILRLVYRLLFLFVAEDRRLLLDPKAGVAEQDRYLRFYSTGRLRRLAERRRGSPHVDLYRGLRLVMDRLGDAEGCPSLGLPPLGSFLWSPEAIEGLASAEIANRDLLEAVRTLSFAERERRFWPVDYRNLGAEELGSIYESLLELHPDVDTGAGTFELRSAGGSERKTTGSYYTPSSLIACLLDSALDPVVDEAAKANEPERAILDLKICDPACGSGHFLIAAAHRVAKRLAAVRTGDEEPSPNATRTALRDVIGHCIYGVDLNPMAVELCKVNLWMEALEPGKPLSFLDHRIQCGNSLLGTTPALMAAGIPDEAFTPIEGDEKEIAAAAKKKNKTENKGRQIDMMLPLAAEPKGEYLTLSDGLQSLDRIDDGSIVGIRRKEESYRRLSRSAEYRTARLAADAWCSAFVWRKVKAGLSPVTTDVLRRIETDPKTVRPAVLAEVNRLAEQYCFFHWHHAFPDVFRVPPKGRNPENPECGWDGGFQCILGNPPWERIQVEEKQFFSALRPEIASSRSKDRTKLIDQLRLEEPRLFANWEDACRIGHGQSHLVKTNGRFPRSGQGNVNTFALFSELVAASIDLNGCAGLIVPSGLLTEASNEELFRHWMTERHIRRAIDFENRKGLFPDIDSRFRFCLLTLSGRGRGPAKPLFSFFVTSVEEAHDPEHQLPLGREELELLNPVSLTCPPIRSRRDAELLMIPHRRFGILVRGLLPEQNQWVVESRQMLNSSHDSGSFVELPEMVVQGMNLRGVVCSNGSYLLRLYDGKMIGQYDHRMASTGHNRSALYRTTSSDSTDTEEYARPDHLVTPQYWVPLSKVSGLVPDYCLKRGWWIAFRAVTAPTNWRTIIATIIPVCGQVHSLPALYTPLPPQDNAVLVACLNSFMLDYCARLKLSGTHLSHFVFKQLPVATRSLFDGICLWSNCSQVVRDWLVPRVLELTYNAWDLQSFAQDCGWSGPPYRWNEARRFLVRCELDAAFFHLYLPSAPDGAWKPGRVVDGAIRDETDKELADLKNYFSTPRDAVAYIMDTFPIVKRKDETAHGEYRTKRVILEIYDEMAEAIHTGKPYRTRLEPAPADPKVAHKDTRESIGD